MGAVLSAAVSVAYERPTAAGTNNSVIGFPIYLVIMLLPPRAAAGIRAKFPWFAFLLLYEPFPAEKTGGRRRSLPVLDSASPAQQVSLTKGFYRILR